MSFWQVPDIICGLGVYLSSCPDFCTWYRVAMAHAAATELRALSALSGRTNIQ